MARVQILKRAGHAHRQYEREGELVLPRLARVGPCVEWDLVFEEAGLGKVRGRVVCRYPLGSASG